MIYLLTSGEYSNYHVDGLLEGPEGFDFSLTISKWRKEFEEIIGPCPYEDYTKCPRYGTPEYEEFQKTHVEPYHTRRKAAFDNQKAKYGGTEFVRYLTTVCGFSFVGHTTVDISEARGL